MKCGWRGSSQPLVCKNDFFQPSDGGGRLLPTPHTEVVVAMLTMVTAYRELELWCGAQLLELPAELSAACQPDDSAHS